jgi:hypothetical protein
MKNYPDQELKEDYIPCTFTPAFLSKWVEIFYSILTYKEQEALNRNKPHITNNHN